MKKIASLFSFLTASILYLFMSSAASAQSICPTGQFTSLCNLSLNNSSTVVGRVVTILLVIAVVLALIFLIWGAIRWITSGGDKGKIDGARQAITSAVIGLILALLAYAI